MPSRLLDFTQDIESSSKFKYLILSLSVSSVVNYAESGLNYASIRSQTHPKSPHHTCCEKAPTNAIIHLL